ncbi:MAG: adenine phosphoribosyltransferase [Propionibacteriaceae bacterium]
MSAHEGAPVVSRPEPSWAVLIRDVPDFPQPGIVYKDITPLLGSSDGYAAAISDLVAVARADELGPVDAVVAMEARGFLLGAPVALALGVPFVPVRKAGKLPSATVSRTYDLEYGRATLELHADALAPGTRVLIVDDLLATGGTVAATAELIAEVGATVAGVAVLIELAFLPGRALLAAAGVPLVTALFSVTA